MTQQYICPLCQSQGKPFYNHDFQKCTWCESIFRCPELFISVEKEKARYEEHNNDILDIKYQKFVSPIVENILKNHSNIESGLDFWAWTWPVISYLLEQKWYSTKLYDPFFHNNLESLEQKYDFIIACEVVEHFHNPKKEFELLYNLLKPGGKLYIMTNIFTPEINFWNWYYKNDKTHVFFYSHKAFDYIKNKWSWKNYSIEWKCIVLEK